MNVSYREALRGQLPHKLPSEVYCHTLTDDSILSPELREKGFHTMTLFGLDTPWSLFSRDNKTMRQRAEKRFVEGLNGWLAEPLEDCLAVARDGSLCIESKSPVDIEDSLGLYHGNIFQDAPTFPLLRPNNKSARGASKPNSKTSSSAAQAPSAAVPLAASPVTTPQRRCWKQFEKSGPNQQRHAAPHQHVFQCFRTKSQTRWA